MNDYGQDSRGLGKKQNWWSFCMDWDWVQELRRPVEMGAPDGLGRLKWAISVGDVDEVG